MRCSRTKVARLRADVELIQGASSPFDPVAFLAGRQTPVFFGSGINNFGVREILHALVEWAPPPQPRDAGPRPVQPAEPAFTGFVFKIQANMDPRHRDRIAFFRICSGRYAAGMKVQHQRLGREIKLANALTFLANERVRMDDAVAGDIIGIHNHGQLQIGDTLTEGEALGFKAFRISRRSCFAARPRDPIKAKQLQKGLRELGERRARSRNSRSSSAVTRSSAPSGSCSSRWWRSGCKANTRWTRCTTRPASIPRAGSRFRMTPRGAISKQQSEHMARDVDDNLVYSPPTATSCRSSWTSGPRSPSIPRASTASGWRRNAGVRVNQRRAVPSACSPASLRPR